MVVARPFKITPVPWEYQGHFRIPTWFMAEVNCLVQFVEQIYDKSRVCKGPRCSVQHVSQVGQRNTFDFEINHSLTFCFLRDLFIVIDIDPVGLLITKHILAQHQPARLFKHHKHCGRPVQEHSDCFTQLQQLRG